jgi:putative ABC transport system permease protein
LFTVAMTLLTGIIFGLAPALQTSRTNLNETLKEGGRGSTEGLRRNRVRSLLVVAEVALSLVLLIAAGLLIQSFLRLLNVSPGFEPNGLLTADVAASRTKYLENWQRALVFQQTLERIGSLPGVESVGVINPLPLGGNIETYSFVIEGRPATGPNEEPVANYRVINPDYFHAMRIPLRRGRVFTERDKADTPPVVVVNETFARLFFAGEDPVGQRITVNDIHDAPPREIIGVVTDVRHAGLDVEAGPEFYFSYLQFPVTRMTVVARTASADPASLAPALRGAIRQVDKDQPIFNVRTMNDLLAESVARRRFNMLLLGAFALVALMLASIGIYGVMSYSVTQRTHEIGIRMALGAQASDVLKMVVRQGLLLTMLGVVAGLVAAFILTRVMAGLLYGVSATDPWTFAGVSLLLSLVALLACYIPARRATKVDPMVALRYE